jgi:hypothetical protein
MNRRTHVIALILALGCVLDRPTAQGSDPVPPRRKAVVGQQSPRQIDAASLPVRTTPPPAPPQGGQGAGGGGSGMRPPP